MLVVIQIYVFVFELGKFIGVIVGFFGEGVNMIGGYVVGVLLVGVNVRKMFEQLCKVYVLMGIELEFDCVNL